MNIQHHPNCTARYPEKPKGEAPQVITTIDIGDGETVYQCSDCGAYVVLDANGQTPAKRPIYVINIYKNKKLIDFQVEEARHFSISTYIREMLENGYGLDITLEDK